MNMWLGFGSLFLGQLLGSGILQIALKFALREFSPIFLSSIRFVIATIGISILIYFSKNHSFLGKESVSVIKRSVLFAANVAIFATGIQYTTVIMAQIIGSIVPILVIIMGYFVLGERLTKNKIIGFIIAFSGLSFLVAQSIFKTQHLAFGSPIGNLLVLSSSICWSTYLVFSKKISHNHSSLRITFINFLCTAITLSLFAPFELSAKPLHVSSFTLLGVGSLVFLSVGTIVQYISVQFGLKHTTATTASFFQYLGPFFGAVFAVPFLHEQVTFNLIVGGALILMGVFYGTTYSHIKRSVISVLQ